MFVNTTTLAVYANRGAVKAAFPNTSLPVELTQDVLNEIGLAPLTATERPAHDRVTQQVLEATPTQINGTWTQQWQIVDLPTEQAAANLEALKTRSVVQIDREVDEIYAAALGNRGPEYTDAEAAAVAYQAAGYTGDVPADVQSWATAKGWTATQAADDILAAAVQLRTAKSGIRAQRLLRKEQIKAAADGATITATMAQWAGFVAAVKAQLGL